MAELKTLTSRRGVLKTTLTRFEKFIADIGNERSKLTELQVRLEKIDLLWGDFDNVQSEIESGTDDAHIEAQNKERELFEKRYFSVMASARQKIASFQTATINNAEPSQVGSNGQFNVKLPQVQLPEFSGEYDKWLNFYNRFNSLIHNNTSLTNIQKFYYLQGALKGEASDILASLETSDVNYNIAWDLLRERFENKKIIVSSHIKGIVELQPISRENSNALRKFTDELKKHYRSLESLKQPVQHWGTILIYILTGKLDSITKREWEIFSKNINEPEITDFTNFLNERCKLLETISTSTTNNNQTNSSNLNNNHNRRNTTLKSFAVESKQEKPACVKCKGDHPIYGCKQFLDLSIEDRLSEAKKLKLCTNCLRFGHLNAECWGGPCKICGKKHNSLLHLRKENSKNNASNDNASDNNNRESSISTHCNQVTTTLLSTAVISIEDAQGRAVTCRALLDSGSQSNFITQDLASKLNLVTTEINIPVSEINMSKCNINSKTQTKIKSCHSNYQTTLTFLILKNITDSIPHRSFNTADLNIPGDIQLADPHFNKSQKIDVLIGAGVFYDLLAVGKIKLGVGKPILYKSKLGWVISGPLNINNTGKTHTFLNISSQLEKFWVIEDYSGKKIMSDEELSCERHFEKHVTRDSTGRFIVKLPLKNNFDQLGVSKQNAIKRFYSVERKLQRDAELKHEYVQFMKEYEALGHMSKLDPNKGSSGLTYYLPHHGVIKHTSTTTKLRVVFDASAKTTTNLSLNDVLGVGPTIQDDLFSIMLRFRKHNIVIVADIAKMYRQIYVHEDQRDLQRIVWRENAGDELQEYRLNTVTYGTGPASFLATRCLQQAARDYKHKYPEACEIIHNDFYVDDLLTGSHDVESTIKLKREIETTLSQAGFELRKWISNESRVLSNQPVANSNISQYLITENQTLKTLGMAWNAYTDDFSYANSVVEKHDARVTKRVILSLISQIFDPLGLVGPVIISAKILMQRLWQLNLSWDQPVPKDLAVSWAKYYSELRQLNSINIPRHALIREPTITELHGFCDASEAAYGACVYLKSTNSSHTEIRLLCAKARVAPIKTISLPRLELCGAILLTNLVQTVLKALNMPSLNVIHYWCDSTIVLHWLAAEPNSWKTFVAHRVSEIQSKTNNEQWRHVSSEDNPADMISRGSEPTKLMQSKLWWNGPEWLNKERSHWPNHIMSHTTELPEAKVKVIALSTVKHIDIVFSKFSSYLKMIRVTAYVCRFIANVKNTRDRLVGPLSVNELENSTSILIKLTQAESFADEMRLLKNNERVASNSKLACLNPFIDDKGLIRVGGRLRNADVPYEFKHQIVLPSKHKFTTLLINHEHRKNLHAGAQTLLATMRQNYWLLNGRSTVRSVLRRCIVCFRARPRCIYPQMGNLPIDRVNPDKVFSNCGVDYAGPYLIKDGKIRNRRFVKSYICIFVCFTTKAVHIELIGDLTSEGFLNGLKRFVSRRGLCKNVYCDNGTNFVGADNDLKRILSFNHDPALQDFWLENRINFHFIPARSPHFGGLWEAAVKSAKSHLNRIVGGANLNYEEFSTLLIQIEAVMNSRPLLPLSSDPNDLECLTPGHFLIGRALNSVPQEDVQETPSNRLSRYHHLQKMYQHFWSRWRHEYLHTLQQRGKWLSPVPNVSIDSLVILKEDNTPPLCWPLGRIVGVHPGRDGTVRVVSVKTRNGIVKRSVTKVCVLPSWDENN